MKHLVQNICSTLLMMFLIACGASETKPDYVGEVSPYAEMEISEVARLDMKNTEVAADADKIFFI